MSNNWQKALTSLQKFIGAHPEIGIEPSSVLIPADVRPEFYKLFDAARLALIRDTMDGLLSQAEALSAGYRVEETAVKTTLKLEAITLPNPLGWFLQNPGEGLMRELFDPLFDLLKGRIEAADFPIAVTGNLRESLIDLYQQGYDKWTGLALIDILKADKLLGVSVRRPAEHREWTIIRANKGSEAAPYPEPANGISFMHFPENIFAVPDFIIHSPALGKYVAVRSGINPAIATAINASAERQWCPYENPIYSESSPLFVYVDDNPDNINLVADVSRICRPDLIIQAGGLNEISWGKALAQAAHWQEFLCPVLGTFMLKEHCKGATEDVPANVKVIEARMAPLSLAPIAEILIQRP